jgi:hypothetical protein
VKLRIAVPLVAAAALCAAASASATTIELRLDVTRDPNNFGLLGIRPDGTAGYVMRRGSFLQTFTAGVVSDSGAPVTGCLDGAVQLALVDSAGVTRATSACTNASGLFAFLPSGSLSVQTPQTLTVTLATPASAGGGTLSLSPATSNRLEMLVQPRIVNETPATSRLRAYPIRVRLEVPPPRPKAGVFVLQRRRGSTWTTIVTRRPNASGRFSHPVAISGRRAVFRVRFTPARGSGWFASELRITITRIT